MKIILRILFLLLFIKPSCLSGQEGFIKTFVSPDTTALRMQNGVYSQENESIILAGITLDGETNLAGVYLVKFDSLGNILKDTIHFDPGGDDYPLHEFLPLKTTSDGGYIYVTSLFFGKQIVVTKIGNHLKRSFSIILAEDFDEIFVPFPNNIFEVEDGYILHLSKQHINFRVKNHLVKIDKEGNFLWEKEYGDDDIDYSSISNSNIVDSMIMITGSQFDGDITPYIMRIDMQGNLVDEIIFDELNDLEVIHLGALIKDSEGNLIMETSLTTLWPNNNGPKSKQLEITKFTSEFNVIWSRQFGPDFQWALADLPTITIDENDNILASGNLVADDGASNPSILIKLSPDGEIIWERRDTLFIGENDSPQSFSIHDTEKHIVLPSGSIVMVGTATPNSDHDAPQQGYIIKVDKDGCIEPGCREVVGTTEIPNELSTLYAFPNPSSGIFTLNNKEKAEIKVFNSVGRHVKTILDLPMNGEINLSIYPNGIYYVQIKSEQSIKTLLLVKEGN